MKKQKRVLHAASMLKCRVGIVQQMQWEFDAAEYLEIPWKTQLYCPADFMGTNFSCVEKSPCVEIRQINSSLTEICSWFKLQKEFYIWLNYIINKDKYDILLLRYSIHDPFLYQFLRQVGIPTVLVHHTLETFELAIRPGLISILRVWAESMMGKRSLRTVSGIIGVTQEIVDYEVMRRNGGIIDIPATVYPNGIYYKDKGTRTLSDEQRTEHPDFLMVASYFQSWHGLDLLLDSIESCSKQFTLHLVGELAPTHKVRAFRDPRIRIHNSLDHKQIKQLAARCWIGLSSFAQHRNCMKQACTLKVREYLMMGLPVYANYEENFPDNFPYFRKGDANIDNILLFANEMRFVSREIVAESAEPYISKTTLLTELYDWIVTNHEELQYIHSLFHP